MVSSAAANKLAVSGSTANLSSGTTRALTATIEDAFGNTITSDTRSVTFAQTSGTGSLTGLGSSNAVAGVATLTVTGNLAGSVTITASATGLVAGTGNPITLTVVAGAAAKLALSGATTDLASGSTRVLTATIQDAASNTVTTGADSTWGKLAKLVALAAAANSSKGSPIVIWPRITSGFTGNCSAAHLLKLQPRVASHNAAETRSPLTLSRVLRPS